MSVIAETAESHVLVFGCARVQRTFRALVPGPPRGNLGSATVTIPSCPGCREEHSTLDIYGHPRRPGEAIDVVLDGADDTLPIEVEPDPTPDATDAPEPDPTPEPERPRRRPPQVSDAVLIAALSDEPTPAVELADALGFARPTALIKRCRKMVERAAAKGEPAPIAIGGGGNPHNPVTLARPR
jgi:hypothetical protein